MSKINATKERLVQVACEIFAEKGFREATVAEICEAAHANISAINYHFGDKEALYDQVWQRAFALATQAYPLDGDLPKNPHIEDRLYAFSSAILHRIFTEDRCGLFAKLLYREMASPTLALKKIAQDFLFPQSEYVGRIVQSVPGAHFDEDTLFLCVHSIIGQCAFYNFSRPLREHTVGRKTMSESEIDRTARHIARFSLGGLKELQP